MAPAATLGMATLRQVLLVAAILLAPATARAACSSASASGLSFGTYTGVAMTPSTATVTMYCTKGYAYQIGLAAGDASGATVSTRQMSYGAYRISYALFQNGSRSTNWGNTRNVDARVGTTTVNSGSGTQLNIYATLAALQYPAPGTYTDRIPATELSTPGAATSFNVWVYVQATCTISATTLDFGVYTGSLLQANSTITATCTNTTPYKVGLSAGNAPGATVTTRRMAEPGGALQAYNLSRDSGHSLNWGNTVGIDTVALTGSGTVQAITVYGQVAAGQSLGTPGTYTDLIVATLTY